MSIDKSNPHSKFVDQKQRGSTNHLQTNSMSSQTLQNLNFHSTQNFAQNIKHTKNITLFSGNNTHRIFKPDSTIQNQGIFGKFQESDYNLPDLVKCGDNGKNNSTKNIQFGNLKQNFNEKNEKKTLRFSSKKQQKFQKSIKQIQVRAENDNFQVVEIKPQQYLSQFNSLPSQNDSSLECSENLNSQTPKKAQIFDIGNNLFQQHFQHQTSNQSDLQASGKNNIFTNCETYSFIILENLIQNEKNFMPKGDFLENHEITQELRSRMVDWLIEVCYQYKCREDTYFLAINIMDRYFSEEQQEIKAIDLHLIGITCLFIACKYEEIYPIRLQTFVEKISHNKLTTEQIKYKEMQILQALGFCITGSTKYDFLQSAIYHLKIEKYLDENVFEFFNSFSIYLSKMILYDYQISSLDQKTVASACIYVTLKVIEMTNKVYKLASVITPKMIQLLNLQRDQLSYVSSRVLELARGFKQLNKENNLKKFNEELHKQLFIIMPQGVKQKTSEIIEQNEQETLTDEHFRKTTSNLSANNNKPNQFKQQQFSHQNYQTTTNNNYNYSQSVNQYASTTNNTIFNQFTTNNQ